jgi:hypothetical protein
MRQAALDLDSLKLKTADDASKVARLRGELRDSLLKDQSRFPKEAQCVAAPARELSAQHSRDSAQMKSRSRHAADLLAAGRERYLRHP